jgi:membrane protease YdiL (CAAX protease family)
LLVIAAPILEELIFRGIVLDGFLKQYSPMKSILISSTLFGLVHLNPWQFITAFFIGIFAGWIYYRTRSLSLAILVHASTNSCAFIARHLIDVDLYKEESLIEGYGGWTNFTLIIISSFVVLSISIYLLKYLFQKYDEKRPIYEIEEPVGETELPLEEIDNQEIQ